MPKEIIYLDNASTTQVYPEVVKVMNEYHTEKYGNPSSEHIFGEKAQKAVQETKKIIAKEINCKPWEIIFTSGATEANNFALKGIASANPNKKKIIISAIEHSSIYETCRQMKKWGYEIIEIPVNHSGFIDILKLESAIDSSTLLVSVMHANNEIGVLQELKKIGEICKKKNAIFHTDAVQSFVKEKINVNDLGIGMLSASAHKIGGPKGIGFLYAKSGLKIEPLIMGGGQESGMRSGTENVPAIAGFAKAVEITGKVNQRKIRELRDYFINELIKTGGKINGSTEKRLANNINASFSGKEAENIVLQLSEKGIMCSTKSACLSKQQKENRILAAIGLNQKDIDGTIRFSLSEFNTKKEIDIVVKEMKKIVK